MKLAGDLAEISLADLVQVSGLARRTCRIKVLTPGGNGALSMDTGNVVAATFGNLNDVDAFVALLAARQGHFQVEPDICTPQHPITASLQSLLLEASTRIESGAVPVPQPAPTPSPSPPSMAAHARSAKGTGSRVWILGVVALAVGTVAWLAFARRETASQGIASTSSESTAAQAAFPAFEASQLIGAGDALPTATAARNPLPPDQHSGFKPTVVCRILVGADGRVLDAKVYRSRLDLAAYEDTALDAVRATRFAPGRHAGQSVAVWLNYPVVFR